MQRFISPYKQTYIPKRERLVMPKSDTNQISRGNTQHYTEKKHIFVQQNAAEPALTNLLSRFEHGIELHK